MSGQKKWISEQLCVDTAGSCNLYCVYCHNPPKPGRGMPQDDVCALIKKRKIKSVSLEGRGEPTANPDFFGWLDRLKKCGVENFMLSTNGIALADEQFCRRAAESINFFTVNFPSHDEETYKKATRSVKYARAVKALENLKKIGVCPKTRLFHIVFKNNYKLLPQFAQWVIKNYPQIAFVNFTFVRNNGRVQDSKDIVPRYTEVEPFLKIALAHLKRAGIKAVAQNFPLCRLSRYEGFSYEFHRWHRGDNVIESGVAAKAKHKTCAACSLEPACCGAREDYLRIYGDGELAASAKDPASIIPENF